MLTAFTGVVLIVGVWADAAALFVPAAASSSNGALTVVPKERLVRIARSELASVRSQVGELGAGRLLLNMDAELELSVAVERTSPTRWGYSLSGRIDDPTVGFVTLVVHDEAVAGAIWTPDASYEVVHLGGGVHAVRDVVQDVRQCGAPVGVSGGEPLGQPENTAAGDENTVVDVLVVWTPQREEQAGSAQKVRAEIELGIAYTNDAFERSGAFVSLNLVGAERVDYDEEGRTALHRSNHLSRLRDPADGYMDAVHGRRDALGADLVSLAVSGSGGVAGFGGFNVASREPSTVAHEFGHNFGLSHERIQGADVYEHGYATWRDSRCTSTIMAYGDVCRGLWPTQSRIPLFSSPALFHPVSGARLGVSRFSSRRGADGPADAVLHLNRVRNTIAGFKPRRSPRSD